MSWYSEFNGEGENMLLSLYFIHKNEQILLSDEIFDSLGKRKVLMNSIERAFIERNGRKLD